MMQVGSPGALVASSTSAELEHADCRAPAASTLTLRDIEDLASWALVEHGLADKGWTFGWDGAIRRAGCCSHSRQRISLSLPIFEIEGNRNDALDVILHEVAHALTGDAAGHGRGWMSVARSIGARAERCHTLEVPAPYVGICACARPHAKVRKPTPGAVYRCRRCMTVISWTKSKGAAA